MGLVVSVNPSRINRLDLFESAGIEVVQGKVATEEDMIELMASVDGAQVGGACEGRVCAVVGGRGVAHAWGAPRLAAGRRTWTPCSSRSSRRATVRRTRRATG